MQQVQRAPPPQMIQPPTPGHAPSPGQQSWVAGRGTPPAAAAAAMGAGAGGHFVMSPPTPQHMMQQANPNQQVRGLHVYMPTSQHMIYAQQANPNQQVRGLQSNIIHANEFCACQTTVAIQKCPFLRLAF